MSKSSSAPFKGARRWTAVEGRAALTALESSGLSLSRFARREGLDAQRLRAWRQRLSAPMSAAAAPTFIEVARQQPIELLEVVLPSGVVLRVAETVDPNALSRIVQALNGASRC